MWKNVWNVLKLAAICWSLLPFVLSVSRPVAYNTLTDWLTDWRSHCCWHESFVDNHNNKISWTRSRSRSRRRREEEMATKRKRTIQLIHHRLKSFKRASLLVLLLVLRFPSVCARRRHTCRRKCAICRWIEHWSECGQSRKRGVSGWISVCMIYVHRHIGERAKHLTHAYIHAHVIQHFGSVQLCAPFSVYFNSYSWRFLHDHNIEKPSEQNIRTQIPF